MPSVYIAINRTTKAIVAASTIKKVKGNAHPSVTRKQSTVIFELRTNKVPSEHQKLINTLNSFRKQFAKNGVTLDTLNRHRAHLSEKGINRTAAKKIAEYFFRENQKALMAATKLMIKYAA